jgi:hypothetical protein
MISLIFNKGRFLFACINQNLVKNEPVIEVFGIICIKNKLFFIGDESVDLSSQLDTSVTVGEHSFSHMQGDLDQQRLLGERPQTDPIGELMIKEMQNQER